MIYSSGKHDKLTADPEPWGQGGAHYPNPGWLNGGKLKYSPRPEFDRPLTNPANRILSQFRFEGRDPYDFMFDLDSKWAYSFRGMKGN